ncbi:ACP S-malonyltransferase [Dyadobacter tibetensis]|uniref:ACP S-malonyltransferase n=1 Tax=Dyadobacter tibetensis TaxID=1211851 RepID=UPI0004706D4A|nr:ACP S-malonyltransferase [Dyadobacter tibetensis]
MKVCMFPGQGSQFRGMGQDLFPLFPELMETANHIMGYDLQDLCIHDPHRLLNNTQYTQPALYVVSVMDYLKHIEQASMPDCLLGHSFGEYVALFAAGGFSFETGLQLVKKRAELMSEKASGGMAALLGMRMNEVRKILEKNHFTEIDIANYNSSHQIVITGPSDQIQAAQQVFEDQGLKLYFPLNVSGAFHSRYMVEAAKEFGDFAKSFSYNSLKIQVISNVTARPYGMQYIPDLLEKQISQPVRWYESISYLLSYKGTEFIELGPGDVLKKMLIHIQKEPIPMSENSFKDLCNHVLIRTNSGTSATTSSDRCIRPQDLGSAEYLADYRVKYAYACGAMVHGIASKELVVKMARAKLMAYFGTGGLKLPAIAAAITYIQDQLDQGESFGMNLLNGSMEEELVDLFLDRQIRNIEASAYMQISISLVRLRLSGIKKNTQGQVVIPTRIMAKVSRPEVAAAFMKPAPEKLIKKLLQNQQITAEQASLATNIPMADDICVEADSGGHTDRGVAFALVPTIMRLRDEIMEQYCYQKKIRVGAAGGIGTPEAAAAAFVLGADFILTGSINQCTVESGISPAVKDLLQQVNIQDTDYAPAGDMFEIGAKVQVLKKGTLFSGRANKLYDLYKRFNALEEIDEQTRIQLEDRYFKRSFEQVYDDVKDYYSAEQIAVAEKNPKQKLAYLFRWYFGHSNALALEGNPQQLVDYQVHCGPAMGAFNQWVKGSKLQDWPNRHVDIIAEELMTETALLLKRRFESFCR